MSERSPKRRPYRAPDPSRRDRHRPFLDLLGRVRPRSLRWYRCRAGLLVLELLDRCWLTRRGLMVGEDRQLAARRAVTFVRPKALRALLDNLLYLAVPGADPQPEALIALGRYAARLQYDGEFRLAAHVYSTIADYANQTGYFKILPEIYECRGTCLRELGDRDAAMASYSIAFALAMRCEDEPAALRVAIAQANLHRVHDNLEDARAMLDRALERARALAIPSLIMRTAHERGIVAHWMKAYVDALVYFAEAYPYCTDAKDRSRLLNDIALALKELGFIDEARSTWLVVYLVTKGERESYARWAAGINLLMLAHESGNVEAFDQYCHALSRSPMPVRLLFAFWMEVGEGCLRFERPAEAKAAFERAVACAKRHSLRGLAGAESALRGDPLPQSPRRTPPTDLPATVRQLLVDVQALGSLPGLLGRSWEGDAQGTPVAPRRTALRRGRPPRSGAA